MVYSRSSSSSPLRNGHHFVPLSDLLEVPSVPCDEGSSNLQGNGVIERIEQVVVQVRGELSSGTKDGRSVERFQSQLVEKVQRVVGFVGSFAGENCRHFNQPVRRLQNFELALRYSIEKGECFG